MISDKKAMISTPRRSTQLGMSLLETVIALTILVLVSVGIMSLTAVALETTENQGHLQSRVAEYAQDKMEQLISLAYGDTSTDTTAFPSASTGGSGLTVGGSWTGYVDYLEYFRQPNHFQWGLVLHPRLADRSACRNHTFEAHHRDRTNAQLCRRFGHRCRSAPEGDRSLAQDVPILRRQSV